MGNKKRHNELRRKQKVCNKRKKAFLKEQDPFRRKIMFHEYLVNCEDALSLMTPADGRIYRLAHSPSLEIDVYPTSLWDYETLAPKEFNSQQTIPIGSCLEIQQEQLREFTLSFNMSVEGVAELFKGRFKKMKTHRQFQDFKSKKGSHIFAYDVNPEDGLMWVESGGHVSFLPYEGFSLDEHLAEGFAPVPIEAYNENINDYIKE